MRPTLRSNPRPVIHPAGVRQLRLSRAEIPVQRLQARPARPRHAHDLRLQEAHVPLQLQDGILEHLEVRALVKVRPQLHHERVVLPRVELPGAAP